MSKPRYSCCLFLALAVLTAGPAAAIADESVGTSAVPFTVAPPAPSKPRPLAPKKRPQDQAPAQRVRWSSYNFPAPNGGSLVYTIMSDGNPACASYDGSGCLWGVSSSQIDFGRIRPLVCGADHRAKWGVTGYEDPKHWCSMARALRASRR